MDIEFLVKCAAILILSYFSGFSLHSYIRGGWFEEDGGWFRLANSIYYFALILMIIVTMI